MSCYYCYYIGIEDKQTKIIEPYGIYDCFGNLTPVVERSGSFATDIKDYFYDIPKEKIGEKLRKEFEYENWNGEKVVDLKYCYLKELPSSNFIVEGYFLINDVVAWNDGDDDSLFYNVIKPHVYAELMKKEQIFGKNQPKKDIEGHEYAEPNASDYIYHSIPNTNSKEYDSFRIKEVVDMLTKYNYKIEEKYDIVIIESIE